MSKPKKSYAKLISEALLNSSNGMLILPDIYKSICARHSYHQVNESGWKTSFRVTLTLTCDARFTRKDTFERHIAFIHEGKKPHKCSFCDRCFAEKRQ